MVHFVTVEKGDSGGGLTIEHQNETRLLGILSHTVKEEPNFELPAYFSAIPYYHQWIQDTIKNNSDYANGQP